MMLRASIPADESDARRALLEEFVAAVVGDDPTRADAARAALADRLGTEWLVDAAAVIANFEMMTRLADGTGARLPPARITAAADLREQHGLDAFSSARQ
jgi:glutathione S-transferase